MVSGILAKILDAVNDNAVVLDQGPPIVICKVVENLQKKAKFPCFAPPLRNEFSGTFGCYRGVVYGK